MGKARRGPSYKYRMSPPCHKSARTAPRRTRMHAHTDTHTSTTHAREDAIRWKCTKCTRTCAHKGTRAPTRAHTRTRANANTSTNAHKRIHFTQRRTHTQSHAPAHVHYTYTHAHAQTRAQTCRETSMRYVSVQQQRHMHLYILRCRESDADRIRNDWGSVLSCMRASVWVCARACARAEKHVSLSRESGRLQACARAARV
jgi:hypothetical protein